MIMQTPILAVTAGEPSGIGPECLLRLHHGAHGLRMIVIADPELLGLTAQSMNLDVTISEWQAGDAVLPDRLQVFPCPLAVQSDAGKLDKRNSPYVLNTISQAVELVNAGHAGALVTGPVHKGIINDAGIPFSGHTEFLAAMADVEKVVMLLAAGDLRVALVTTHLPLRQVADAVNLDNVIRTIQITHDELRSRFSISHPRLQVLGLNPHAGEGGHLGHEDDEIIAVAIEQCIDLGIDAFGPVPADTAFNPPHLAKCDAVIAMYHDQGLPVLKHAGFGSAVNITLGLPFIRTSVDHGTALDIAGQGVADAGSFLHAARMAQRMCGP